MSLNMDKEDGYNIITYKFNRIDLKVLHIPADEDEKFKVLIDGTVNMINSKEYKLYEDFNKKYLHKRLFSLSLNCENNEVNGIIMNKKTSSYKIKIYIRWIARKLKRLIVTKFLDKLLNKYDVNDLEFLFFTSYDEYNKNNEFQIKDCDYFSNYKIIKVDNLNKYDFKEMCYIIGDIGFAIQVVNLLNKNNKKNTVL